ncbi:LETM1-like protein [Leeuwenhoekiella aestuarii]|uniref:LETM1-like protein n=1 Tax=Leeuwenhoekiella aestuarii TaxID=2249426 RepID=A0A4Q0NWK3_9FLAO|nr:LETM1-related biofilm-associated protein [Leeuwenhoekiella aestuarii]RXG15609.1 LETM1-like protein [Leeuwenhoekiella aestuarii]RXG17282.1 LETM1-like protein [Leeuwenhoekiella aestuarii]
MNPSSFGWITKHQPVIKKAFKEVNSDLNALYELLLQSGFIYGVSVTTVSYGTTEPLLWNETERTKLNFFDSLYCVYYQKYKNDTHFFKAITEYYEQLDPKEHLYFTRFSKLKPNAATLEKIIQERIQTNEHLLQKNFSNLITNALLFIDVLSFQHYLEHEENISHYASELEATLMNVIWLALIQKEEKEQYDKLLLKLFEKSLRYNRNLKQEAKNLDELPLDIYTGLLEKRYLLDLAALAIWDDVKLDKTEYLFLKKFGAQLLLSNEVIELSTTYVHTFIQANRKRISYLNYSNPVKHFYTQTSQTVKTLIFRNKNRLLQELSESKDLVLLLGQSTVRDLSKAEKKRVKSQLLDICKSIPSLAIFMLPGGGILLPLLVKFIPELLPSAFNENRIEGQNLDDTEI